MIAQAVMDANRFRAYGADALHMKLNHGLHLSYCTNIHRGETWAETFAALKQNTLKVRERVCPDQPYGIGLRLSNQAAVELNDRATLLEFQRWLASNHCYVFTINGFPYGQFHGTRIKEQVYAPDWTTAERLAYTNLLFDLLAQLVPSNVEGSVSTLPGGFKLLVTTSEEQRKIRDNLWRCVEHVARVSSQTGRRLHLGLEPEPMCLLETTGELVHLFDRLRAEHKNDPRLKEHLGINYDTCHLAVEFEEPEIAVRFLQQHGVRISKFHLSSALKLCPTIEALEALKAFQDEIYLHQVVVRQADGNRSIYLDLDDALACERATYPAP
jgi:sugar phosphate isomerase/epimerase